MSWLNWLAIGTVAQTYYINADYDEVRDWYTAAMIQQRQAAREAEREGVELPVWDGEFRVQRLSGRPGVVVFKESVCFRELTY